MSFYTDCRLYLISPPTLDDLAGFAGTLAETLAAGDVAAFQLRLKDADETALEQATARLMSVCHAHDVAFILNDRPDLAAAWNCDGAHIGKKDGPVRDARQKLGADRQLGVSCYGSRDQAMDAAEAGADYVAFGSFYPTETKAKAPSADPETLHAWVTFSVIPAVATGGITVDNCLPLIQAGAHFLAVSNGIWGYKDGPAQAVRDFNRAIQQATPPL